MNNIYFTGSSTKYISKLTRRVTHRTKDGVTREEAQQQGRTIITETPGQLLSALYLNDRTRHKGHKFSSSKKSIIAEMV